MLRAAAALRSSAAVATRCKCPPAGRPARLPPLSTRLQQPFTRRVMASKPAPAGAGPATTSPAGAGAGAPAPPPPPTFTLLSYTYVPDILERRGPHRAAHIAAAKEAVAAGRMVLAGATGDPVGGALFVWAPGVPAAEVEAFAAGDPYVVAGLVPSWKVEPYMVVAQGP